MADYEMMKTTKGKAMVKETETGHLYTRHYGKADESFWYRCAEQRKRACRARVNLTVGLDSLSGGLPQHNHLPDASSAVTREFRKHDLFL